MRRAARGRMGRGNARGVGRCVVPGSSADGSAVPLAPRATRAQRPPPERRRWWVGAAAAQVPSRAYERGERAATSRARRCGGQRSAGRAHSLRQSCGSNGTGLRMRGGGGRAATGGCGPSGGSRRGGRPLGPQLRQTAQGVGATHSFVSGASCQRVYTTDICVQHHTLNYWDLQRGARGL